MIHLWENNTLQHLPNFNLSGLYLKLNYYLQLKIFIIIKSYFDYYFIILFLLDLILMINLSINNLMINHFE